MASILKRMGLSFDLDKKDLFKIFLLAVSFFCVIGAYTIIKEMKDILFVRFVGAYWMPKVKILSMFVLVPATLFYAKLVDMTSKFRLLCIYSGLYGGVGLLFAYLLGAPGIGLMNTHASPYRLFGWIIYLFYEGAVPFVVSVFWSFSNSVTSPEAAKKGYPLVITGSKFGGMVTAGFAWLLLSPTTFLGRLGLSDIAVHQILLSLASLLLCIAPFIVAYLLKISGGNLHGYEASYKEEKKQEKAGTDKTGIFSGLKMMVQHPYILGVFGMIFFYELLNVVLGYQRLIILQASTKSLGGFTGKMFEQRFIMHSVGLLISFFGTRVLIKRLGERICLLLIPIVTGALLFYFMVAYDANAILVVFMGLGTLNYAFASPLRESLYIPTVKDIRFKSKSWIDSFGMKISKGCGSTFNEACKTLVPGSMLFHSVYITFFTLIIGFWVMLAWWLGRQYCDAVENNKVIGSSE